MAKPGWKKLKAQLAATSTNAMAASKTLDELEAEHGEIPLKFRDIREIDSAIRLLRGIRLVLGGD